MEVKMQNKRIYLFLLLAIFVSLTITGWALPEPAGYLNDFAGVLSSSEQSQIESSLTSLREQLGLDFVIVTVDDITTEYTPKSYAVALFEEWGIGQSGKDNGLLLLNVISGDSRSILFEVGYGLEAVFTDVHTGVILDDIIPSLQQSNYYEAYRSAITSVQNRATAYSDEYERNDGNYQPNKSIDPGIYVVGGIGTYIFLIIIASLFGRRSLAGAMIRIPLEIIRILFMMLGRGGGRGGFGGGSGGGFGGFGGGRSGGGGAGRRY